MSLSITKISEEELISLLSQNSKKGIALLYDNYSAVLYGIVLKIVKSEEAAKDVLQDTFIKIWKNFSSYDKTKGSLMTWMLNIARNRAIDYTRSKAYSNLHHDENRQDNPVKINETSETKVDQIGLDKALVVLSPEVKEVIEVVYYHGYSHSEAAEHLNIPLGTVKTRVRNGLKELRKVVN